MIDSFQDQSSTAPVSPFGTMSTRPGMIFSRALRDSIPSVIIWGVGYSILIATVVILYPILEKDNTLLGVLNGLGVIDLVAQNYPVDVNALASFVGYLAFEALGWGPTLLSIYVVPQTLNAVMGEETAGTLDLLMGTPITRWQFLTEKALAVVCSIGGILLISWLSLNLSVWVVSGVELKTAQASAGIWHIFPILIVIAAVTLFISMSVRHPRLAGGLAAMFVIGSYFLRSIANASSSTLFDELSRLSIYHYYSSIGAMVDGVRWDNDLLLIGAGFLIFLVALWRFQRRDLGV